MRHRWAATTAPRTLAGALLVACAGCDRTPSATVGGAGWGGPSLTASAAPSAGEAPRATALVVARPPSGSAAASAAAEPRRHAGPGSAPSPGGSAPDHPQEAPSGSPHAHGGERGAALSRLFEGSPPADLALPVTARWQALTLRLPAGWSARPEPDVLIAGAPGAVLACALGPRSSIDRVATERLHTRISLGAVRWEEPVPSALGAMGLPMTVTTGPAALAGAAAEAWLVVAELDGDRRLLVLAASRADAPPARRTELAAAVRSLRVSAAVP